LAVVAIPFGVIGRAVAAAFGLVFGVLALLGHAWGRWRKIAFVGIAISSLALLVFGADRSTVPSVPVPARGRRRSPLRTGRRLWPDRPTRGRGVRVTPEDAANQFKLAATVSQ
jgi:hypothetical protein